MQEAWSMYRGQCEPAAIAPPPPLIPQERWTPRLADAERASTFAELRHLLSGRRSGHDDAASHGVSPDIDAMLEAYASYHELVRTGQVPLRMLVVSGSKNGLGDRAKAWRVLLYLAVLSGRAIFLDDPDATELADIFEPHRVDWRLPKATEFRTALADGSTPRDIMVLAYSDDMYAVTTMLTRAFSSVPACVLFINRAPLKLLSEQLPSRLCSGSALRGTSDRLAVGVPPAASFTGGGDYCFSRAALMAVMDERTRMPMQPALDFLFRPHPTLLSTSLVPLLRGMSMWQSQGPRVCAHVRTFDVDPEVQKSDSGQNVLDRVGGCYACLVLQLARTHGVRDVMLASDSVASVGRLEALVSPLGVGSMLRHSDPRFSKAVHLDDVTASRQDVLNTYAEVIALSACDVIITGTSGFSLTAAQWGRLPTTNVRHLAVRQAFYMPAAVSPQCPSAVWNPDFYNLEW
jgi:hypothetical protein